MVFNRLNQTVIQAISEFIPTHELPQVIKNIAVAVVDKDTEEPFNEHVLRNFFFRKNRHIKDFNQLINYFEHHQKIVEKLLHQQIFKDKWYAFLQSPLLSTEQAIAVLRVWPRQDNEYVPSHFLTYFLRLILKVYHYLVDVIRHLFLWVHPEPAGPADELPPISYHLADSPRMLERVNLQKSIKKIQLGIQHGDSLLITEAFDGLSLDPKNDRYIRDQLIVEIINAIGANLEPEVAQKFVKQLITAIHHNTIPILTEILDQLADCAPSFEPGLIKPLIAPFLRPNETNLDTIGRLLAAVAPSLAPQDSQKLTDQLLLKVAEENLSALDLQHKDHLDMPIMALNVLSSQKLEPKTAHQLLEPALWEFRHIKYSLQPPDIAIDILVKLYSKFDAADAQTVIHRLLAFMHDLDDKFLLRMTVEATAALSAHLSTQDFLKLAIPIVSKLDHWLDSINEGEEALLAIIQQIAPQDRARLIEALLFRLKYDIKPTPRILSAVKNALLLIVVEGLDETIAVDLSKQLSRILQSNDIKKRSNYDVRQAIIEVLTAIPVPRQHSEVKLIYGNVPNQLLSCLLQEQYPEIRSKLMDCLSKFILAEHVSDAFKVALTLPESSCPEVTSLKKLLAMRDTIAFESYISKASTTYYFKLQACLHSYHLLGLFSWAMPEQDYATLARLHHLFATTAKPYVTQQQILDVLKTQTNTIGQSRCAFFQKHTSDLALPNHSLLNNTVTALRAALI